MAFGMMTTKPSAKAKKAMPQADKSKVKGKDRAMKDGPARDAPGGKDAGKPPMTAEAKVPSKTIASMKDSIKNIGRY